MIYFILYLALVFGLFIVCMFCEVISVRYLNRKWRTADLPAFLLLLIPVLNIALTLVTVFSTTKQLLENKFGDLDEKITQTLRSGTKKEE